MPKEFSHIFIDTPQLAADVMTYLASEKREWLCGRYVSVNRDMQEFLVKRIEIEKHNLLKLRMAVDGWPLP